MSSAAKKILPYIGAAIDTCDDNLEQARRGRDVEAPKDDATTGSDPRIQTLLSCA